MMLFGRSRNQLEAMTAEFLPFEKQLHIIVADADMNIQVLQFDPESKSFHALCYHIPFTDTFSLDPKSMGGLRLLHKSTFHTGYFPVTTHLLTNNLHMPSASDFNGSSDAMQTDDGSAAQPLQQILLTTQAGSLGLLTPLTESAYRRLGSIAGYLSNTLDHACGMNPRVYRAVENEIGVGGGAARGVVDGTLLLRWGELGEGRRREGLGKVGGEEWVFRGEREILSGRGLFGGRA